MKDKILETLKLFSQKTGGNCGMRLADIAESIGVSCDEVRAPIEELLKTGSITIHDAINYTVIKWVQSG